MFSKLAKITTLCVLGAAHVASAEEDRCTAILVGAKASTSGAPMTTHTADCKDCDFRIVKVPAMDFEPNATADITLVKLNYPRYVGEARGPYYAKDKLEKGIYDWAETETIGTIPQVNHTYAYLEGLYGLMNEHQLAMGESTCGGVLVAKPVSAGGKALLDISQLSRLGMQRAKTARGAVQVMGDLAMEYGYYGAAWEGDMATGEAGECLTISDSKEAWMFHIHPDDTGAQAVWVAQRVPDDGIAACANAFVIHQVDFEDKDNFMHSGNLIEVAERAGLYNKDTMGEFDFTRVYGQKRVHPSHYYATRRQWRVLTLANPDLELSPWTDPWGTDYPFSTSVKKALSEHDIMQMNRDHFENTEFDMTKGPKAGPFGNPERYDLNGNGNMTRDEALNSTVERSISLHRTSYSIVTQANPDENSKFGKVWFAPYNPHAAAYVPFYSNMDKIPDRYSTGSLFRYNQDVQYWAYAVVGNWVSKYYMYVHPVVEAAQKAFESKVIGEQDNIVKEGEALLANANSSGNLAEFLNNKTAEFTEEAHSTWTSLFHDLITKFHDGYTMNNLDGSNGPDLDAQSMYYPKWWLERVGAFAGYNVTSTVTNVGSATPVLATVAEHSIHMGYMAFTFAVAVIFTLVGLFFGRRSKYSQYKQIN